MGYITAKLTVAPTALKARLKILPNKMATRVTRIRDRKQASRRPSRYRAKMVTVLARPIFTPGTAMVRGNRDSR